MTPTRTAATLIYNWPTLYRTRTDALKHVFTSPHWHWVDGELVADEPSEIKCDPEFSQPFRDIDKDDSVHDQLFKSRENMVTAWTKTNAHLLSQDDYSEMTHDCIWLPDSYNRFADMPENVTDEWREAAHRIAFKIHDATEKAEKGSHEYNAHRVIKVFLFAHGLLDDKAADLRIAELEDELAGLRKMRDQLHALI